jgi:hypothetical protein
MAKFMITRDDLEAMYQESNPSLVLSFVHKYRSQIIRTNAKGMKTCTCYFGNEDQKIIKQIVDKLKEIFVDTSFTIMRRHADCGEILVDWTKQPIKSSNDTVSL